MKEYEDLIDTDQESGALPEIALKYKIVEGLDQMFKLKVEVLDYIGSPSMYKTTRPRDLEKQIVYVFDLMSEMIKSKKLDRYSQFRWISGISRGKSYKVQYLILMVDYLKMCAHRLRLTDLIIAGGKDFDAKLRKSFGR